MSINRRFFFLEKKAVKEKMGMERKKIGADNTIS